MKNVLITGILGQDGPFLAKQLLEKGYKVYGLIRRYSNVNTTNLDYLDLTNRVELITGDITDPQSVTNIIKGIRPDFIYNLAAQSHVGESWEQPAYTIQSTGMAVVNILEAMRHYVPFSRYYQASSSEMFGKSGETGIQNESTPFYPRSPYACAKVLAHNLTINYRESYNMFCCCGILFNHESEIRGEAFVTRKISLAVANIKAGNQKEVNLGNLDAYRDWGYSPDFTRGMILMLEYDNPEDYVLCTGETHTIREFLDEAFKVVGIDNWESYVKINPQFIRPAEVTRLIGSYEKAKRILNWEPLTKFKDLVKVMVNADLKRVI